jgi:thymidine phosphorylase
MLLYDLRRCRTLGAELSRLNNTLKLKRLGIDTHRETVLFVRRDCHICRAEGLTAQSRVKVTIGSNILVATVNHIRGDVLLSPGEAGLSEFVWGRLGLSAGDGICIEHLDPLDSLSLVRAKIYGKELSQPEISRIIFDVAAHRYSHIHLSAFIAACASRGMLQSETIALTRAMVDCGETLRWENSVIADKHCVGGLPGNRTTPIVVAIAAACGLTIPKTSSRAITSPAGTADTMEMLAPVELDLDSIQQVVRQEGGCIAWGGAANLSPADDIMIVVERALEIDSEGQLAASILSKKVAAGSTHLVLDIPVGGTAKVRSVKDAETLSTLLTSVASEFGLKTKVLQSDGSQPVGRGIGPALEARDVLAVLNGAADAPFDLKQKSVRLSAALLELTGKAGAGKGLGIATHTLESGKAWAKFQNICQAQGGMRAPPEAKIIQSIAAERSGVILSVDNRRLAKLAKLAGAPEVPEAGVDYLVRIGEVVTQGSELVRVHAQSSSELRYAFDYISQHPPIIEVGDASS